VIAVFSLPRTFHLLDLSIVYLRLGNVAHMWVFYNLLSVNSRRRDAIKSTCFGDYIPLLEHAEFSVIFMYLSLLFIFVLETFD
jgi:hypothetical protein